MRQSVAALTALVVLAVPAAVSCSTESAPSAGPTGRPTQSSTAQKPVADVGQTLDLVRIGAQKIAVTVTQIVNPATATSGWAEPGNSYVAAQVTIKNTGTTTIVGNSNSDVSMIGSDDRDYRADFATVTECKDFNYGWFLLAAGDSTRGCVVFKLPPGVSPAKVKYHPSSGISHDVGEWRAYS